MREAGDEHHAGATCRHRIVDEAVEGIRQHGARIDRRFQRTHLGCLVLGGVEHDVVAPPQRAFAGLHRLRLAAQARRIVAAGLRGLFLHAPEMQVVPVVGDRATGVRAHGVEVRLGHVGPRQQHRVGPKPGLAQHRADALAPTRAMEDFHAHRLQPRRVHRVVPEVVRPELDHRAGIQQGLHERDHRARTGVPVGLRHVVVDHQHHRSVPCAVARAHHLLRVRVVRRERIFPACAEGRLVAYLVGLHPAAGVGAVRNPLVVHHPRERRVVHLQTELADPEAEVGILAIGRRVTRIEAAQPREQRARQQQRRAGTIVDPSHVVELGSVRIAEPAVVPRRRIAPHDAAGFLQPAIGEQQHGAGDPGIRMQVEHLQQRVQPARRDFGVVVEEADVLAAGQFEGLVARAQEAEVLGILVVAQARHRAQRGHGRIAGGVLQNQHFRAGHRRVRLQRAQAARGVVRLAPGRDDDGDSG